MLTHGSMGVPRILILSACIVLALSAEETGRQRERKKDDISGPIVRATVDREKDSIILQANLSTEGAEKKKTIAQYIDEALEQEFPEDKSKDGKNYNETAKQEDVSALITMQSISSWLKGFPKPRFAESLLHHSLTLLDQSL